jgi:hypothetical protein
MADGTPQSDNQPSPEASNPDTGLHASAEPPVEALHAGCTLAAYAETKRLSEPFLRSIGLSEIAYLGAPAVRIPYRGTDGSELAVRFRIGLSGRDKFRWRKGSEACLYGLDRLADALQGKEIALVEGESDGQTLWQGGFAAIGLPGASSWQEERDARLLDGFAIIYILVEPDSGGEAVQQWLARSRIRDRARLVQLGDFKDPSEMYCVDPARFRERWLAALAAATPWRDEETRAKQAKRDALWTSCSTLALERDILAHFARDLALAGVVGEERGGKILYLAIITRVLYRVVSVVVKGPSSGGKNWLVEHVLAFFPPHVYYALSAMSERALAYSTEPLQHKMLVIYEAVGMAGEFATYLMRSLLSEGRIRYETVERTKDGLRPRLIEREGPTGLIVTTTAGKLHPENETRMLSTAVNDTPEQTALIVAKQAECENSANATVDFAAWHALADFTALGPTDVLIPFARTLAELVPPCAVRLRRDFGTVLRLVKAHALLHQATRATTSDGRVIATLDDYQAVRELIYDLIAEGVEAAVPKRIRETVAKVRDILWSGAEDVSITRLAMALKLDRSAVSRRVTEAIGLGYLRNDEERKGRPAKLAVGDPMPLERQILPTLDEMQDRCSVDGVAGGIEHPPSPHPNQSTNQPGGGGGIYIPPNKAATLQDPAPDRGIRRDPDNGDARDAEPATPVDNGDVPPGGEVVLW